MTSGERAVLGAKIRVPRIKGLPRERLDALLAEVWHHRLGLVVAPAGSGKTTLLAHFAAATGAPVAWYRAEPADASAAAAVAHLERGLVAALGVRGGWRGIDDAIEALDGWTGERALLAVDDLHSLWGTEAEATLERLLAHLPPGIVMVAATRRAPGFNLSRLRVSGELLELGTDELRFRSWEVERLFFEFYGESLRPDELAELARRTEGWAAGLQLFHLATRGKPAGERRRMLHELGMRSRLVREYLARNVLDELPLHVRDFLLQTCVLGRLTAPLCDAVRGATSSDALLAELEQRQIFTAPLDDEGSYRYHEVLRSYLEGALVEAVGEAEARRRYRAAAVLLEAHGHLPEALRAFCRAEDWASARALLGDRGEQLIDRPGAWLESLPPTLLEQDPWLLLASARRAVAEGRWESAIEAHARAEAASTQGEPAATARRERLTLEGWLAPAVSAPVGWAGILRLAVVRDPVGVVARERERLSGASGALAAALALLLAGQVADAIGPLDAVRDRPDASPAVSIGAGIAGALARTLAGHPQGEEIERLSEAADAAGFPWLVGLTRLASAVEGGTGAMASVVAKDHVWGLPLAQLCTGLGQLATPGADGGAAGAAPLLREAADGFAAAGAKVLEGWALSAAALAQAATGMPGSKSAAVTAARRALRACSSAGLTAPVAFAAEALAIADPAQATRHRTTAKAAATAAGLALGRFDTLLGSGEVPAPEPVTVTAATPAAGAAPALEVRCFGPLELTVDGEVLDLAPIKPRVRSLLRVLALHAGRPVHRDRLIDWLWPGEGDQRVGTRNLQVAVSALRQLLEPGVARGAATVIVRDADTYRLQVEPGHVDLVRFDDLVALGRHAQAAGDPAAACEALDAALALYRGELLADEGAAEWVIAERDRARVAATDASLLRGQLLLAGEAFGEAAGEAERGLRIDPYRDALWRLLIESAERAGDRAMAHRHHERYAAVLEELGLSPSS